MKRSFGTKTECFINQEQGLQPGPLGMVLWGHVSIPSSESPGAPAGRVKAGGML